MNRKLLGAIITCIITSPLHCQKLGNMQQTTRRIANINRALKRGEYSKAEQLIDQITKDKKLDTFEIEKIHEQLSNTIQNLQKNARPTQSRALEKTQEHIDDTIKTGPQQNISAPIKDMDTQSYYPSPSTNWAAFSQKESQIGTSTATKPLDILTDKAKKEHPVQTKLDNGPFINQIYTLAQKIVQKKPDLYATETNNIILPGKWDKKSIDRSDLLTLRSILAHWSVDELTKWSQLLTDFNTNIKHMEYYFNSTTPHDYPFPNRPYTLQRIEQYQMVLKLYVDNLKNMGTQHPAIPYLVDNTLKEELEKISQNPDKWQQMNQEIEILRQLHTLYLAGQTAKIIPSDMPQFSDIKTMELTLKAGSAETYNLAYNLWRKLNTLDFNSDKKAVQQLTQFLHNKKIIIQKVSLEQASDLVLKMSIDNQSTLKKILEDIDNP